MFICARARAQPSAVLIRVLDSKHWIEFEYHFIEYVYENVGACRQRLRRMLVLREKSECSSQIVSGLGAAILLLMYTGTELIVDAFGCEGERLADLEGVRRVCLRIVSELGLTVVGIPQWHQFPSPGGVTGMYLLSESHLTCHTFPEFGMATFNLYCCRSRPDWPWGTRLKEMLGAKDVEVKIVSRGIAKTKFTGYSKEIADGVTNVNDIEQSEAMLRPVRLG